MTNKRINARIFWKNVREQRDEKQLQQSDMARALGISGSYYGNLERGIQRTVNQTMAERVAAVLGVSVEELTIGEAPQENAFWKNVKQRRTQLKVTQEEMAQALGMEPISYSMKERMAPSNIKLDEAQLIAAKLETSIAELMGRKEMVWSKLSERTKDWLCNDKNIERLEQITQQ